jgi:hypothetical protein
MHLYYSTLIIVKKIFSTSHRRIIVGNVVIYLLTNHRFINLMISINNFHNTKVLVFTKKKYKHLIKIFTFVLIF